MALSLDTLTSSLSAAAKAAGQAASTGGKDITGDVQKFVVPQMQGIASQIIAIETGGFDEDTAKKLLSMELIHVNTVVCTVSELVALEVQNIINAALQAIAATVNGALGFVLI